MNFILSERASERARWGDLTVEIDCSLLGHSGVCNKLQVNKYNIFVDHLTTSSVRNNTYFNNPASNKLTTFLKLNQR